MATNPKQPKLDILQSGADSILPPRAVHTQWPLSKHAAFCEQCQIEKGVGNIAMAAEDIHVSKQVAFRTRGIIFRGCSFQSRCPRT